VIKVNDGEKHQDERRDRILINQRFKVVSVVIELTVDGVIMNFSINAASFKTLVWCLVAAYGAMLIPTEALAVSWSVSGGGSGGSGGSDGGTIGNLLCNVAGWFTGSVGKGIATLAIIVIGIGALMGKVSWGMAIIVGIGVAVIFGAPTIVDELGTGGSGC
jgi:type IV secretory pathway VirB2 component (pilin)